MKDKNGGTENLEFDLGVVPTRKRSRTVKPEGIASLFDEPVAKTEPMPLGENPVWEWRHWEQVDLIAPEPVVVVSFKVEKLEAAYPGLLSQLPLKSVFEVFVALREHKSAVLRRTAFTVFGGWVGSDLWGIGFSSTDSRIINMLCDPLRKIPGQLYVDSGTSQSLMPCFRYDHGYIIQYVEPDAPATTYLDGEDNYGTGLTIYRRPWQPAELHGKLRSAYGKLKVCPTPRSEAREG